jgi:glycogen debranching enzyme
VTDGGGVTDGGSVTVGADVTVGGGVTAGGGVTHDASIRPNQLFAVSLPYSVLSPEQMRAVVQTCARDLLTSYGLRSLSARDAAYRPHYTGNAWERDSAYHQGTVWSWLLGPFARAHYRVYGDAAAAQAFLCPIEQHLEAACLGSVSEVFDGDAPHNARGCFAQAWSVAEILRTWLYLQAKSSSTA